MEEIYAETMAEQQKGFNCAETVMLMTGKYYLPEIDFSYSNLVTGFGGGVGRSRAETCGALTGSVVALSMLIGRHDTSKSVDEIHPHIAEFRDIFLREFDNSICEELRKGYDGDAAKKMCHEMTAKTVILLFDFLKELGIKRKV